MTQAERHSAAALQAALAQLPLPQRTVFHAVAINGDSHADAATRLGMSTQEVECQLAAALVELDKALATRPPHGFWRRLARRFVPGPSR